MLTIIKGGTMVNEGRQQLADIIIDGDRIKEIIPREISSNHDTAAPHRGELEGTIIDAAGAYVLPGIIDSHVHFREPGLTHKATMESESRAAAYGGVTTVFDMPNTKPQTTTPEALQEKHLIATGSMHVNYAFFPGATNDNADFLAHLDPHTVPGIKLFMGSSTGNMLVDHEEALDSVFAIAHDSRLPIMAHCEDTAIINRNMSRVTDELQIDDPPIQYHPYIRSEEACYRSSALAAQLARRHATHLHIAHVTTARELTLLGDGITGEATVAHLLFSREDYDSKGSLIKCNPAIKTLNDRDALRLSLKGGASSSYGVSGGLCTIGTDHAPHTLDEKQGGCAKAMSGMPMIQYSLPAMLSLVDKEVLTIERMVELMAHNPARLFAISQRGFLQPGYKADITIVKREDTPWTVTPDTIQSLCHWSPVEGMSFHWHVAHTIVNGNHIYDNGIFHPTPLGEPVRFRE